MGAVLVGMVDRLGEKHAGPDRENPVVAVCLAQPLLIPFPGKEIPSVLASNAARSASTSSPTSSPKLHGRSGQAAVSRKRYDISESTMWRRMPMIEPYVPGAVAFNVASSIPWQYAMSCAVAQA